MHVVYEHNSLFFVGTREQNDVVYQAFFCLDDAVKVAKWLNKPDKGLCDKVWQEVRNA